MPPPCLYDYTLYHDDRCIPEDTYLAMTVAYNLAVVPLLWLVFREARRARALARRALVAGAGSILSQSLMSVGWAAQRGSYELYFLGFALAEFTVSSLGLALLEFFLQSLVLEVPRDVLLRYRFILRTIVVLTQVFMAVPFLALTIHYSRTDRNTTNTVISVALGLTISCANVYIWVILFGIYSLRSRIRATRRNLAEQGAGVAAGGGGSEITSTGSPKSPRARGEDSAASTSVNGGGNSEGRSDVNRTAAIDRFLDRVQRFALRGIVFMVWISAAYFGIFIVHNVYDDSLSGWAFSIVGFSSIYYMVLILYLFLRKEYKIERAEKGPSAPTGRNVIWGTGRTGGPGKISANEERRSSKEKSKNNHNNNNNNSSATRVSDFKGSEIAPIASTGVP